MGLLLFFLLHPFFTIFGLQLSELHESSPNHLQSWPRSQSHSKCLWAFLQNLSVFSPKSVFLSGLLVTLDGSTTLQLSRLKNSVSFLLLLFVSLFNSCPVLYNLPPRSYSLSCSINTYWITEVMDYGATVVRRQVRTLPSCILLSSGLECKIQSQVAISAIRKKKKE